MTETSSPAQVLQIQPPETVFDAAAFIASVRAAQAARGKPVKGPLGLKKDVLSNAAQAINGITRKASFNAHSLAEPLQDLLLRFLEMARRNQIAVPKTGMKPIAARLLTELARNVVAFKARKKPGQFVPLTLYHGAGFAGIAEDPEFKDLADTPGMFKRAALNSPADPKGLLRQVQSEIRTMMAEPEFKILTRTPGIFKHAALHSPAHPRRFLRGILDGSIVDERWKPKATGSEFSDLSP